MFELKEAEDDWEMLIHDIASSIKDEATIKGVYSLAKLLIGDSKKKEIEKILTNDENIEDSDNFYLLRVLSVRRNLPVLE